ANMADAYYRLGSIFFKRKHLAQAQVLLSKAVDLTPDADFAREARKTLLIIDAQFKGGGAKNHGATAKREESKSVSQKPEASDGEQPESKSAGNDGAGQKKFGLFKRKARGEAKDSSEASNGKSDESAADGDLKETPQ
ncbi:MAG TPA: tetratricopeptide repeat protein, partial [Chroococcales cyanobacterium]